MAVPFHLVALALAGAQPAVDAQASAPAPAPVRAAATVDAAALLGIFESACLPGGSDAPAGFETAAWSDFPAPLRLMNTYTHEGSFSRSADRAVYFARTSGPGHMAPGLEKRCAVAAQGVDPAAVVERLKARVEADKASEVTVAGVWSAMLMGKSGFYTVTRAEGDWLIVRSMDILIPANMVSPRHLRRKGKGKNE